MLWLAENRGLIRYFNEPDEEPAVWVMARLTWDSDARIVSKIALAARDPLLVALEAVEEVMAEVSASEARRVLRLV